MVAVVFTTIHCSDSKESPCSTGDMGLIPGSGRSPGGGHGNPLQYSCLENPHGQRSLVGYIVHGVAKSLTQSELLALLLREQKNRKQQ